MATRSEILGYQSAFATEFVEPGTYHFIRLKSSMPNQDSSMLIHLVLTVRVSSSFLANYYLSTRFLIEF